MDDRLYWLGFSSFPGIGPYRFKLLIEYFDNAKSAWTAGINDLKKSGIGEKTAEKLIEFRSNFSVNGYYRQLQKKNIDFLIWTDPDYPKLLSSIKNPPIVLYYVGNFDFLSLENQKAVAVIGTRKITPYGTQVTNLLVNDLVQAGCVIVSGLAIGVDSIAHSVTVENNGKTIAVLGSGVDYCTPRENITLYQKIISSGGAIVSEYPLGQQPTIGSFPSRNRIIAGLSDAVLVTEGTIDSGALITAKDAFANNRKVFACPGPITSNYSKGPNSLLAQGALPITCAGDILKSISLSTMICKKEISSENIEEQTIINLLKNEQMHIDELIKRLNLTASKIGITLSLMEMKGMIRNCGSGIFALAEIT